MRYDIKDLLRIFSEKNFDFNNYYAYFDQGVVKIKSIARFEHDRKNYGNDIGPRDGTFVFPKKLLTKVIEMSENNPRKLEKLLSLEEGILGDKPIIIEAIEDYVVRIPTGQELGANRHWLPGGFTCSGIPEAVVDCIEEGKYRVYPVFG